MPQISQDSITLINMIKAMSLEMEHSDKTTDLTNFLMLGPALLGFKSVWFRQIGHQLDTDCHPWHGNRIIYANILK